MDSEPTGDPRSVPVEKLTAMRARCEHLEAGLKELAKGNLPFSDAQLGEDGVTRASATAMSSFAQECLDQAPPTGKPDRG